MKFLSRLAKGKRDEGRELRGEIFENGTAIYDSILKIESKAMPGVKFAITGFLWTADGPGQASAEISQRVEFLEAGNQLQEKMKRIC